MADPDKLPRTFKEWQQIAQRAESSIRASGVITIRAMIDPATFPEWCRRNNLKVDAEGRMAFANAEAYRKGRN